MQHIRQRTTGYIFSSQTFRNILEGRQFINLTDHKPLTYTSQSSTDRRFPREIRHLDFIVQFTNDIRYIEGGSNVVAVAMSRTELCSHI
ncbi:unnamed protein product [Hymenolepis diminuta]|uniref:Reverse transcriptase RNase H-like domain-containing protein n=1 Tax=Hymenolepis diminuta TaxID=6216 RepID=A0A0R3SWF9_HYMDI|nr:unnamed protein product [Hymenolepis diminuta]